jgi:metal-dependent amidase/aminoacylase/carboxypeptidase family protein
MKMAKELLGEDNVQPGYLPVYGSEDFGEYLQKCPGTFFILNTKEEKEVAFLHNSKFDFNDAAI